MITEMNKIIQSLEPNIKAIQWQNTAAYANWLSQAYYIARRSTSYLGLTLFHAEKYPEFQLRCAAHISEETGHEKLINNDLKRLGLTLMPELPSTSAIYQPQYYRIVSENPLSFLGYVFFLELLAPAYGPFVVTQVTNKAAVSFLKVHTKADEDHIAQATEIFEKLPMDLKEKAMSNFKMTSECYRSMLLAIAQHSQTFRAAA